MQEELIHDWNAEGVGGPAGSVLLDDEPGWNPVGQSWDVRDHAYHPVPFAKSLEGIDNHFEGFWVQGAKSLIDEDRLQPTCCDPGQFPQPG